MPLLTHHAGRALLVCVLGASTLAISAFSLAAVVDLVDERLALMAEVAAYKWVHDLPIEDLEREAAVIVHAEAAALRHGIEVDATRELFHVQMAAAKEIQAYWFGRWSLDGAPTSAPDLVVEIRPRLLGLGERILASLASEGCCAPDVRVAVGVTGLSDLTRSSLRKALMLVRPYPDRLTQIRDSGVLRIGTTGDYAPFSYGRGPEAVLAGIDIDLGRDLAVSLGVQARFVGTSWPTLMDDLVAGRYDIGMGGVSWTAARERVGRFSSAYHVGGKTVIARCAQRAEFASWGDVDRPGVRVIVNPGGTNERFLDEHLRHAEKIVHKDNITVFDQIIAGAADAMITDRIEVRLQSSKHSGVLCPTMAQNLNRQEKAYLLPRDDVWRNYVNEWLQRALRDGTLDATFQRHLGVLNPPEAM